MSGGGIHYYNVKSLGKDSGSYYSIVAIDCNGLSSITPSSGAWPVVLITAPVDKYIGGAVEPVRLYSAGCERQLRPGAGLRRRRHSAQVRLPHRRRHHVVSDDPGRFRVARLAGSVERVGARAQATTPIEVQAVGTTDGVRFHQGAGHRRSGNRPPVANRRRRYTTGVSDRR